MFALATVPTLAVSITCSECSDGGVAKSSVCKLAVRWKSPNGFRLGMESSRNASAGRFPLPESDADELFLLLEVTTAEVPIPSPTTSLPRTPRSILGGDGVPSRAAVASSTLCFS